MDDTRQNLMKWGLLAGLSAFGGLVRFLSGEERLSHKRILAEIIIAIFAGVLITLLLSPFAMSEQMQAAAAALSGYSSKAVLYIIEKKFLNKIEEVD